MERETLRPEPDALDEAVRELRETPIDESRLAAALDRARQTLAETRDEASERNGPTTSKTRAVFMRAYRRSHSV